MKRKNEQSTRELMGTKELSDYSIRTYRKDELVYFLTCPCCRRRAFPQESMGS